MKAILCTAYGGPDVLRVAETETPVPADDEVRIKIHAATVSTADCEVRGFKFPLWLRLPLRIMFGWFKPRKPILGQEIAGEVDAVGQDVTAFKKGDQIFAPINGFGGHAEFVCLPARSAIAEKPTNLTYEKAACLTVFALNALHFVRLSEIEPGQSVLINGAGGGMGTIAVQLAKLEGAEVTAVDRGEKLDMLRAIGADHVIDYRREDFADGGKIYDVILDVHGKSHYSRCLRSLAPGGRYVLANPRLSSMLRGIWTSKTTDKKVRFAFAGYRIDDLLYLKELAEAGKISPVIDRRYPLEQAAEAHRYVDSGQKKGNVVLSVAHADENDISASNGTASLNSQVTNPAG